MFSKNSVDAAQALAQLAASQGKTFVPQSDTPLGELVKTSYLFDIPVITEGVALEGVAEQMSLNSNNSSHNERHDYLIDFVARAASMHMDYARNIVLPAVEAVSAGVQKAMDSAVANPLAEFCLVMQDLPTPLQNESFLANVLKEASGPFIEPDGTFRFGEAGPMAILERLETGSKAFDDKLKEWAAIRGDLFFTSIWDDLFRSVIESQPTSPRGFLEHVGDIETGVDAALAIFLIARRLSLKPEPGAGVDEQTYRDLARQYMEVSSQVIARRVEKEKSYLDKGALIIASNMRTKHVVVHGTVYRNWLRTGGKNEVIFGLMVQGDPASYIDDITPKADAALQAWDRFASITRARYNNEKHVRFVTAVRDAFYADMRQAGPNEKEYQLTHPEYLDKVTEYLEDQLQAVTTADTLDLVRTVCRIVCKARFYYNDAYKVLLSIDNATRANPNLSLQDAVAVARAEYVVDYISSQIRVV